VGRKSPGVGDTMSEGDFEYRRVRICAEQGTANGIQPQRMKKFAWTLIESRAESIFEFAPADGEGEADLRHTERFVEVLAHPCFGTPREAGSVAEGIARWHHLSGQFAGDGSDVHREVVAG